MDGRSALRAGLAAGWLLLAAGPVGAAGEGLWFPVGERIAYRILWGRIPAAVSVASSEWVDHDGRRLLAIRFETKSNRVLSTFYPVDDFIESLVEPETFLPVRFTKRLNEGRYHCDETTEFDHERGVAVFTNNRSGRRREYAIEPDTRDLVSFMYGMRRVELPVGSRREFRVMADEKLYDLTLRAAKKVGIGLPNHGKVNSVQLEPEAAFQGLFVRSGKMTVWVSDDDRRVITKAAIKVPVAHVNLVLDKVSGPGDDAWVVGGK